jgi:hypothetical protein
MVGRHSQCLAGRTLRVDRRGFSRLKSFTALPTRALAAGLARRRLFLGGGWLLSAFGLVVG